MQAQPNFPFYFFLIFKNVIHSGEGQNISGTWIYEKPGGSIYFLVRSKAVKKKYKILYILNPTVITALPPVFFIVAPEKGEYCSLYGKCTSLPIEYT